MCVCSHLHFCICVCVSCVCSALSPGTSAMPPVSQFLTSLLKTCWFRQTSSSSSHPTRFSWDGLEETYNHSRRSSPTARVFDFPLPSPPPSLFISLFLIISFPNWLSREMTRKLVNRKQREHDCFLCVILTSQLHCECRLPRDIIGVSTHSGSHQKPHILLLSITCAAVATAADSFSNVVGGIGWHNTVSQMTFPQLPAASKGTFFSQKRILTGRWWDQQQCTVATEPQYVQY